MRDSISPVSWNMHTETYDLEGKKVIITSGFIELNPEYCFDTEEMKLVIPFVKATIEPKEKENV